MNCELFDKLIAYEEGRLDRREAINALFQQLIDTGDAWHLQGWVGATAMDLIQCGECLLGPISVKDYWGGHVPSRYEVDDDRPGSIEYQRRILGHSSTANESTDIRNGKTV